MHWPVWGAYPLRELQSRSRWKRNSWQRIIRTHQKQHPLTRCAGASALALMGKSMFEITLKLTVKITAAQWLRLGRALVLIALLV